MQPVATTVRGSGLPLRADDAGEVHDVRVRIRNATKLFTRRSGEKVPAIDDISLEVQAGEFLVLLGPSGCGKTTLLRALAGLETLDRGFIEVEGVPFVDTDKGIDVPPERRHISMMFQSYALWPHMSVFANVAYPLSARKVLRKDVKGRVERVLDSVGISDLGGQYPNQISGGQQQRVALARALVAGDAIVLFDEPLSNVDAKVREQLRTEILRLHRTFGFTAIYVTHDQDEAMALATRVAVLREGKIAQCSSPVDVYRKPENAYVARFMGATNEIRGTVSAVGTDGRIEVATSLGTVYGAPRPGCRPGAAVTVFTRPEAWRYCAARPAVESNVWPGELQREAFQGFYIDRYVRAHSENIRVRSLAGMAWGGDGGWLTIDPQDVLVLAEA